MRDGSGMGMTDRVPWKSPAMYSRIERPSPAGSRALGPSRLAREPWPLPLATQIALPLRANRTEVGYQPVGMKPSGVLAPGSLTLTTARLLVLALATSRIDSSAESASALGVQPAGAPESMAVPIVSMAFAATVSMTLTELRLALATYSTLPPRAR